MNQVSATATLPARRSEVYKTVSGEFWHLETKSYQHGAAYVRTMCGRRLGRWNLVPGRPAAAVAPGSVCVGCLRKVEH